MLKRRWWHTQNISEYFKVVSCVVSISLSMETGEEKPKVNFGLWTQLTSKEALKRNPIIVFCEVSDDSATVHLHLHLRLNPAYLLSSPQSHPNSGFSGHTKQEITVHREGYTEELNRKMQNLVKPWDLFHAHPPFLQFAHRVGVGFSCFQLWSCNCGSNSRIGASQMLSANSFMIRTSSTFPMFPPSVISFFKVSVSLIPCRPVSSNQWVLPSSVSNVGIHTNP